MVNPRKAKRERFTATLQQLIAGSISSSSGDTAIQTDTVELPLMQVKTFLSKDGSGQSKPIIDYTFFAGVGFDSLMLQDYKDMQAWSKDKSKTSRIASIYRFLKDTVLGRVTGYTIALFAKTLPQCIDRNAHLMEVCISTDSPVKTHWIDHRRGDLMRPVVGAENDSGESDSDTTDSTDDNTTLLYQGQAGIVAAGTAPFYGGGLRLFPFARMTPHGMHLRVGRIHPLRGVLNIPDLSAKDFGCIDFVGSQFEIKVLSPTEGYPVQHSGESVGRCTKVQFQVAADAGAAAGSDSDSTTGYSLNELPLPPSMRFVTLLPPRLVVEEEYKEGSDI
ncbi:MAG: hypothetical protein SGARI_000194 [Bacillariaceae sp.]